MIKGGNSVVRAFDVAIDIPDGHVIHFELEITDSSNNTWTSNFNVVAHAPVVEFGNQHVPDTLAL